MKGGRLSRSHSMPFGAQVVPGKGVRFRLWAPEAHEVDLYLEGPGSARGLFPMESRGGGWVEKVVEEAGTHTLYRFRTDGGLLVPDPASRYQPADVHGPSEVVDPCAFLWEDDAWKGRPWEETVLYELHVGAFTRDGSFEGITKHLEHLADLGVTAIELMPVADFPGRWNWGYDGVLLFAPDSAYGRPEDLKALVNEAHRRGLMVFLDVVYNHFGPEGNYLYAYARQAFFSQEHQTPWGAAIRFQGQTAGTVRDFYIHNVLFWLEEYHMDGLRLDAVHAIRDDSRPDILEEMAARVEAGPARGRHIHLILENDDNKARYLERSPDGTPTRYTAQWNDDIHHACHVLLTGEKAGYYGDYAHKPLGHLGRCLVEGFAYQGEPSPHRGGRPRGEPSRHLPPTAFVSFLQNHDQIGNRAFGERLIRLAEPQAVRAALALVLLAPSVPLLFMGEEWGCARPFTFFCDFGPDLAAQVTEGRRREFARFHQFRDPEARKRIPDPNAPETFAATVLDWETSEEPAQRDWKHYYQRLLTLRRERIVPLLGQLVRGAAGYRLLGNALECRWPLDGGTTLVVLTNLTSKIQTGLEAPAGDLLYGFPNEAPDSLRQGVLPPWSVVWLLAAPRGCGGGAAW